MVQWAKVLAVTLKDLSLIPGAHMAEGEDQVLWPPCVSGAQPQINKNTNRHVKELLMINVTS